MCNRDLESRNPYKQFKKMCICAKRMNIEGKVTGASKESRKECVKESC